jgi:hypothetical protein
LTLSPKNLQAKQIEAMNGLANYLRSVGFVFTQKLVAEAAPLLRDRLVKMYPAKHVRTGLLRRSIDYKISMGMKTDGAIRIMSGVRKLYSPTRKRHRRRRPDVPNYGQFQKWLFGNVRSVFDTVLAEVMKKY